MGKDSAACRWLTLREALESFVHCKSGFQAASHIRPLHWHVACRLVLEGGFPPDDITPRPPFRVTKTRVGPILEHDDSLGEGGERTVLGGLKTKMVDVVVSREGIGPVIAVSVKGTLNAFRNLTNRMEEAVGDCANLHIAYPALVYGFLHVLRANTESEGFEANDIAILRSGQVVDSIRRYHDVLIRLTDRSDLRNDTTRYEAISLALAAAPGNLLADYPDAASPLHFESFFQKLYRAYDHRYVYAAPNLERRTRRLEWHTESPILADPRAQEYPLRLAAGSTSPGDDKA